MVYRTQETFYFNDYQFIGKDTIRNSQMAAMHRARCGEGSALSGYTTLSGCITPPAPPCVQQLGSTLSLSFKGFKWEFHVVGMLG